jgi:hypothetical protein
MCKARSPEGRIRPLKKLSATRMARKVIRIKIRLNFQAKEESMIKMEETGREERRVDCSHQRNPRLSQRKNRNSAPMRRLNLAIKIDETSPEAKIRLRDKAFSALIFNQSRIIFPGKKTKSSISKIKTAYSLIEIPKGKKRRKREKRSNGILRIFNNRDRGKLLTGNLILT